MAVATLAAAAVRLSLSARQLQQLNDRRHQQAITDDLTGLGNRRRLSEVLGPYFDDMRRGAGQLAFLFVDLDVVPIDLVDKVRAH